MDAAIYATLGGLLVASLSGLAYLAIRFPETYALFGKPLFFGLGAISGLSLAYILGVNAGADTALAFVDPDKFKAALAARIALGKVAFIVNVSAVGLAAIVLFLGAIGERASKEKREANSKDLKRK
jgi:hypothetical protein